MKFLRLAILLLALALWSCGGGGYTPSPGPPPPGPTPPQETVTKYLGWYDLGPPSCQFCYLEQARQSSNLMYMRVTRDEYVALIPKAVAGGWKAVILMGHEEDHPRTAQAAQAIVNAGLNLVAVIYCDEPDLSYANGMTLRLIVGYNALKAEMTARGLGHIPLGATWSLAGQPGDTWCDRYEIQGIPPMDIYITDGWYTGRDNELHLVRHRFIEWADYLGSKLGPKPFIHVIKTWGRVPPDIQIISPEWVVRQLKCVLGTGTSAYHWVNPNGGEADVIVEPLPAKYQGVAVLMYKMDPTRNGDTSDAGGNRPDLIQAVREHVKPLGLTMEE